MSVFPHILVPVDGSDQSTAAVTLAVRLARDQEAAQLLFCYVINLEKAYRDAAIAEMGPSIDALIDEEKRSSSKILAAAQAIAAAAGVRSAVEVLQGDPPDAIAERAHEGKFDLIVAGTHGRSGVERMLFGSTAEQIMRHADVPVLLVKS